MGVDVNGLMEIKTPIDTPMERVDDVVRIFGPETTEQDASVAEDAVGIRLREVKELGAGANVATAKVIGSDA